MILLGSAERTAGRPTLSVRQAVRHSSRRIRPSMHMTRPTDRGYTRVVTSLWRRRISAAVVSVLAVLPMSGALCASLCAHHGHAEATAPHGHHAAAHEHHTSTSAEQPAGDARGALVGTIPHDCNRHGGPAGATSAALTAARAGTGLTLVADHGVLQPPVRCLSQLRLVRLHSGSGPPPGLSSPTRAPLVLRI